MESANSQTRHGVEHYQAQLRTKEQELTQINSVIEKESADLKRLQAVLFTQENQQKELAVREAETEQTQLQKDIKRHMELIAEMSREDVRIQELEKERATLEAEIEKKTKFLDVINGQESIKPRINQTELNQDLKTYALKLSSLETDLAQEKERRKVCEEQLNESEIASEHLETAFSKKQTQLADLEIKKRKLVLKTSIRNLILLYTFYTKNQTLRRFTEWKLSTLSSRK